MQSFGLLKTARTDADIGTVQIYFRICGRIDIYLVVCGRYVCYGSFCTVIVLVIILIFGSLGIIRSLFVFSIILVFGSLFILCAFFIFGIFVLGIFVLGIFVLGIFVFFLCLPVFLLGITVLFLSRIRRFRTVVFVRFLQRDIDACCLLPYIEILCDRLVTVSFAYKLVQSVSQFNALRYIRLLAVYKEFCFCGSY